MYFYVSSYFGFPAIPFPVFNFPAISSSAFRSYASSLPVRFAGSRSGRKQVISPSKGM